MTLTVSGDELASQLESFDASVVIPGLEGITEVDGMQDMFADIDTMIELITDTTRYYALSIDELGVVVVSVPLSSEIVSDNPMLNAMMSGIDDLNADIEALMIPLIESIEVGDNTAPDSELEPLETADDDSTSSRPSTISAGALSYTLPEAWLVIDDRIEGGLVISNDPNADLQTFSFGDENALLFVQYGIEFDGIMDAQNLSEDDPLSDIATTILMAASADFAGTNVSEVQAVTFGQRKAYTISFESDVFGATLNGYILETDNAGRMMIFVFTRATMTQDTLRDVAMFIASLS